MTRSFSAKSDRKPYVLLFILTKKFTVLIVYYLNDNSLSIFVRGREREKDYREVSTNRGLRILESYLIQFYRFFFYNNDFLNFND